MGIITSKIAGPLYIYDLFTIGYAGDVICVGSFSSLENAKKRFTAMSLRQHTWVDRDIIDNPVELVDRIWETNISVNTNNEFVDYQSTQSD
jgi:hypothetical protein